MKKIFTLLFFVAAMAFAANADDGIVKYCIDVVLGNEVPSAKYTAANLDVNNDGKINVADVTMLIKMQQGEGVQAKALARKIDVDKLIKESLETETGEPNISDVNQAIDHNIKIEKEE
jgi:hypothetical protein